MPFTSYASLADVARAHQIHLDRSSFVEPIGANLSDHFRSELDFTLREVPYDSSEATICQTLIYPLLREVWKPFSPELTLWCEQAIHFDADLNGFVDYLVARRSPLGPIVLDVPYLLVVEAKKDDFVRGWGQCLAAMVASRKINGLADQTIFGISTNGLAWQFGRLLGDELTQHAGPFSIREIDDLAGALTAVLSHCRDQAALIASGAPA